VLRRPLEPNILGGGAKDAAPTEPQHLEINVCCQEVAGGGGGG
jgi:hypothetical protein